MADKDNDLLAACFTLGHLMEAARLCSKGVTWKGQVQKFLDERLCRCAELRDEILSGTWEPRPVQPFTLMERGKLRRVMPVNMRDRVVERCLCDNVLVPLIERTAIKDSSACFRGRGLDYAIRRVREHLEQAPPGAWVFQFDFHDYFHCIDRSRVIAMLRRHIPECFVRLVALAIGGADGIGLELGSHVCQLMAVWYPTPLDHLVQSLPGFVGYHRYMDDGIGVFASKAAALNAKRVFVQSAESMGLAMNPHKTYCNRATHPIVFCKTRLTKRASGVRVTVRKPQTRRLVRHIRSVIRKAEHEDIDVQALYGSCLGYINRGDADLTRLMTDRIEWPPLR